MNPISIMGLGLQSGFPPVTAQERINCYLEMQQDGEKSQVVAYGTPGYELVTNFGNDPIRGGISFNDFLYVVHDDLFYKVDNAGNQTELGTITTTTGKVFMACNGFEILVTDGTTSGHVYEVKDDTTVTIDVASPGVVNWTAHNMPADSAIVFTTTGTMPTGLTAGTTYYIKTVLGVDSFTVSATQGGTAINVTGAGSGTITASTRLALISDADYPQLETCTFMDGYFIGNQKNTGKYYISALYNGQSWNALDFASAESNPDNLVRVYSDHGGVMLLGDFSTEIVANNGAQDFPFARVGYPVEWGLAARSSVARMGDSVAFLARNRMGEVQVVLMNGYNPQRISTFDIERILNASSILEAATAYAYMMNGHQFYQLNAAGESFLYDATTGVWSTVKANNIDRHRGEMGFNIVNSTMITDFENGKIYRLRDDVYEENGEPLVMELTGKHIFNAQEKMSVGRLFVDMLVGWADATGQGSTPQIMLQVSRDGGNTWGNELWKSFGKIGKYLTRVEWYRLGRGYNFTFRLKISDPVKRCIIAAWMDAA